MFNYSCGKKTCIPFLKILSNPLTFSSLLASLKEGNRLVTNDTEITNVLNKYFVTYVWSLAEKVDFSAHALYVNDEKGPHENSVTHF